MFCALIRPIINSNIRINVAYRPISTTLISLCNPSAPAVSASAVTTTGIKKDRTEEIPVETSIRYLKSSAYNQTYGEAPVWVPYRRNHKGSIPPKKTRRTCIRGGQLSTGNPCPICRDEYLVLHEHNISLLEQFICPHTGSVLSYKQTGLCQKTHQQLTVAIERARNRGLITFDVPFRKYNYDDFYKK